MEEEGSGRHTLSLRWIWLAWLGIGFTVLGFIISPWFCWTERFIVELALLTKAIEHLHESGSPVHDGGYEASAGAVCACG